MKFTNCERRNKAHPKTFQIPPKIVRNNLTKGDSAKLVFEMDKPQGLFNAERMWVKITGRTGNEYIGKLNNWPVFFEDLSLGDEIRFEAKHIADVEFKKVRKAKRAVKK